MTSTLIAFVARFAVLGAVGTTMYFNGSYALSKTASWEAGAGLLAMALTIDLCKCTFLPISASLWAANYRFAALLLFLLWTPCLAYSTFAGYAQITTQRTLATVDGEANAEERSRAQAAYDRAVADLATAMRAEPWKATSACTLPRKKSQHAFCTKIAATKAAQTAAEATLARLAPAHPNPELTGMVTTTGLDPALLTFLIAFVPALLLELLASVGGYAVSCPLKPTGHAKAPGGPVQGRIRFPGLRWPERSGTQSTSPVDAVVRIPLDQPKSPSGPPQIKWTLPAS